MCPTHGQVSVSVSVIMVSLTAPGPASSISMKVIVSSVVSMLSVLCGVMRLSVSGCLWACLMRGLS